MCNIAGYIGPQEAAPVLCEMMRRESGFFGGYYSGIVTVSNGKLHYAKTIGDMDLLTQKFNAESLPGQCGLIHSRSNSGGDSRWSHPFLSNDSKIAYIANGSGGKLAALIDRDEAAQEMESKGYKYDSADERSIGAYPKLSDGRTVHGSETMTFLIRDFMMSHGVSLCDAMALAFIRFPAEIIGLSISSDEPDKISFARYNMPCMVGRTADEVFIASTALAFPDDRDYISITPLPECSYGTVSIKETVIKRFSSPIKVTTLSPMIQNIVSDRVNECLKSSSGPCSFGTLARSSKDIWPDSELTQRHLATYLVLYDMVKSGEVEIIKKIQPGAPEGKSLNIKTTQYLFKPKSVSQ